MPSLRVVIIGAGLAGPCLAQGLLRAGADVSLYERDVAVASRGQGYRIHIARQGTEGLRTCLAPELYRLVVDTSGKRGSGVTVLDRHLHALNRVVFPAASADDGSDGIHVDRLTARQVLLSGLGGRVHFGASFTHFEVGEEGGVRVHFANGEVAEADLLVGADGPGSPVRAQLLPEARVVETGTLSIFGKTPLTEEVRSLTPPAALDGFSTVVGPNGCFLPLAAMEFRTDPAEVAAGQRGIVFADTRDYVMWVMCGPAEALGAPRQGLGRLSGDELIRLAARTVRDWHPSLAEIVRRADPDTVTPTSMRTAEPVERWQTRPVTLVGDAIHCMIPAGIGAAVALQDAGVLTRRLAPVIRGEKPLVPAVAAYEEEMLRYGFEAVAASKQVAQAHAPS